MKNILICALLLALAAVSCSSPGAKMRTGDLIFVAPSVPEEEGMDQAIISATGSGEGRPFTHVAIVERSLSGIRVIDAAPSHGVSRRTLAAFMGENESCSFELMRVSGMSRRLLRAAVSAAKSHLWEPYDFTFLPDNGASYCSELVYDSYLSADGSHIFGVSPMNFLDSDGSLPEYWEELFEELEMDVPQGVPGTNPQDMSKSPVLRHVISF